MLPEIPDYRQAPLRRSWHVVHEMAALKCRTNSSLPVSDGIQKALYEGVEAALLCHGLLIERPLRPLPGDTVGSGLGVLFEG